MRQPHTTTVATVPDKTAPHALATRPEE
jgi:hypothetical protein